jgi:hypothetical protein
VGNFPYNANLPAFHLKNKLKGGDQQHIMETERKRESKRERERERENEMLTYSKVNQLALTPSSMSSQQEPPQGFYHLKRTLALSFEVLPLKVKVKGPC